LENFQVVTSSTSPVYQGQVGSKGLIFFRVNVSLLFHSRTEQHASWSS